MINRSITNVPRSLNCDFEKAVFNAARKVFGSDLCIYGCYFHLAQNIQKRISKYDLLTTFYSSEDFRTNTQFLIGKSKIKIPRFPMDTWNLYERVLQILPKTNNTVESWHSVLSKDEKSHLTCNKLIEKLHKKQSYTENILVMIETGQVFK